MKANHEVSLQCTHKLSEVSQDFCSGLEQNTHSPGQLTLHFKPSDVFPLRWINFVLWIFLETF